MEAAPKPKKTLKTIAPTKTAMPEQPAAVRAHNWSEVTLGYTEEQAVGEAARCIQCKNPGCIAGCPVVVTIGPPYILAVPVNVPVDDALVAVAVVVRLGLPVTAPAEVSVITSPVYVAVRVGFAKP